MTPFPIVQKFEYPKFNAITFPEGGRVYITPDGARVPSVTTILSTLPKEGLDAWRARVGDEKADQVSAEACRVGTTMHDTLEGYVSAYLQGRADIPPVTDEDKLAYTMAENIKRYALVDLDEVWGIEEALYCHDLYAGRTDLLGIYRGKSAVIDYKSTKRWKKPEWVEHYKMQLAAYNFCHFYMFGERMETGVILMAVRPPAKSPPPPWYEPLQRIILNRDEMLYWEEKWLDVVVGYHNKSK